MPLLGSMSDEARSALREAIGFAVQECADNTRHGVTCFAAGFVEGVVEQGILGDDEAILVGWSLAAFIVRDRFLAALLGESWGRFEEFWDLG